MIEVSIEIYLVEISLQRSFFCASFSLEFVGGKLLRMFGRYFLRDILGRNFSCGKDLFSNISW